MDTSSFIGEQINPFDPDATWAPSAFDMRHNFIASYNYDLPLDRLFHRNALTVGWTISGITRFSSGFPVTLYNDTDSSLLGTFGNGVNNHLLDTPAYTPGCHLEINHDPAKGPAFNTACFSIPPLGQLGNAPRRFFYGPGIINTDLTLLKSVSLRAGEAVQFRLEAFNVFNRAQFYGPGAVDGNVAQLDVRPNRAGRSASLDPSRRKIHVLNVVVTAGAIDPALQWGRSPEPVSKSAAQRCRLRR